MTINEFISVYSNKIVNGESSLFLGAGFSRNSGLPSWEGLIRPCAEKLNITISNKSDFLQIAQYYQNRHGRSELNKLIQKQLRSNMVLNSTLTELLQLEFKNIWTTNFDTVIENSLNTQNIPYNIISSDKDLYNINEKNVNIFKCGGDIQNLCSSFLTKTDYEDYLNDHKNMLSFLMRELIINNLLFIGYSFNDELIKQQLRNIKQILGQNANIHYAILFNNKDDASFKYYIEDLEKNYNIEVVLVEDNNEFIKLIQRLIRQVKKYKVFISGSFEKLPFKKLNYVTELCKVLCKTLLDNHYCIVGAVGKNIGNYIGGTALKYLSNASDKEIKEKIMITPLPISNTEEENKNIRLKLISNCGSVIFIAGQSTKANNEISEGTMEEFKIAKKLNKRIIPLATTGYASKKIYDNIKSSLKKYPYLNNLEPFISSDAQNEISAIQPLVEAVIGILKS